MLTGPNGSGKTTVLEAVASSGPSGRSGGRRARRWSGPAASARYVRGELDHDERPSLGRDRARAAAGRSRPRSTASGPAAPTWPTRSRSPCSARTTWRWSRAGRRTAATCSTTPSASLDRARPRPWSRTSTGPCASGAALLRQAGGRLTPEVEATLDVWDERLAAAGDGPGGGPASSSAATSHRWPRRPTAPWPRRRRRRLRRPSVALSYRRPGRAPWPTRWRPARSDDLRRAADHGRPAPRRRW